MDKGSKMPRRKSCTYCKALSYASARRVVGRVCDLDFETEEVKAKEVWLYKYYPKEKCPRPMTVKELDEIVIRKFVKY